MYVRLPELLPAAKRGVETFVSKKRLGKLAAKKGLAENKGDVAKGERKPH